MVSTTHHVTAQQSPAQSHAIGAANVPETDGFDFMSYLLGLQVGAQPENMLMENDAEAEIPTDGQKPEAGPEDQLLSIFGKKKNEAWNPMFPNGLLVAPNASPMNAIPTSINPQEKVTPQGKLPGSPGQPLMTMTPGLKAAVVGQDVTKPTPPDVNLVTHRSHSQPAGKPTPIQSAGEELKSVLPGKAKGPESTAKSELAQDQASIVGAVSFDGPKHAKVQATGGNPDAYAAMNIHALQPKEETLESKKTEGRDFSDILSSTGLGTTPAMKPSDGTPVAQSIAPAANQTTVPELFSKVESMVHNGGGKMTVSLTPPHLGKVEIQVTTRGKKVEIEISSQSDLAKSVLESKLGDLKQSLHSHDLQLAKVDVQVSKDLARPFNASSLATLAGGNNAYQQQQSQGFWNQSQANRSFGQPSSRTTNPTPERFAAARPAMMVGGAVRSNPGHVDIRI